MTIEREVDRNGGTFDTIKLTLDEKMALSKCHDILKLRFEEQGETYDSIQREMCEWWLLGILRFDGVEKMTDMAKSAQFHDKKQLMEVGYIEIKRRVSNMKNTTSDDVRYTQQTKALDDIAAKLGVVAYRPDYHGSGSDKNTVMFYTPEDAEHNRMVNQQPTHYSRSAAADLKKQDGSKIPDEYIYRDSFWSFENSDVNGRFDMESANCGRLDLRCPDWKEKLEGHIGVALSKKRQNQYVLLTGGLGELRESDEIYNDFNRSIIAYMKMAYGCLYLGSVNYYGEQGERIRTGTESVYETYTGQQVFNFHCDFAVPCRDEELERMIRVWNQGMPNTLVNIEKIMDRIDKLGGINFVWY